MRDGELESELGVIRTAIMIDFLPTRTPLPFTISSSQAHRQLWVQIHMRYARTATHFLCLSQLGRP